MNEVDQQSRSPNQAISRVELNRFIKSHAGDPKIEQFMLHIHRYAQRRSGKYSPSLKQVNKALGDFVKYTARAAKKNGKPYILSTSDMVSLAMTWSSGVDASKAFRNQSPKAGIGA